MKIFFVGIHNKPNTKPLDSSTKSGKLVDKIILNLGKQDYIKTNLFNLNEIPKEIKKHQEIWIQTYGPTQNDVVILLGSNVHKFFPSIKSKIIKAKHPSAIWSNKAKENYVKEILEEIKNYK